MWQIWRSRNKLEKLKRLESEQEQIEEQKKITNVETEEDVDLPSVPAASPVKSITKSGRVRKKSAKLLEMEASEKLDNSSSKRLGSGMKGTSSGKRKAASQHPDNTSVTDMGDKVQSPLEKTVRSSNTRNPSEASFFPLQIKTEPESSPESLKLKFSLGSISKSMETFDEFPRKNMKTFKPIKETDNPIIGSYENVALPKEDSGLKMKLVLSTSKQSSNEITERKRKKKERKSEDEFWQSPIQTEKITSPKKSPITRKSGARSQKDIATTGVKIEKSFDFSGESSAHFMDDRDQSDSKRSMSLDVIDPVIDSGDIKVELADDSYNMPVLGIIKTEPIDIKPKLEPAFVLEMDFDKPFPTTSLAIRPPPKPPQQKKKPPKQPKKKTKKKAKVLDVPASPEMAALARKLAMKVMTSAERRAQRTMKGKGRKPAEKNAKKKKRRKGPTAYTLWCNSYRNKVVAENPSIDFSQMSKRLAEIWHGLPAKQKMAWRRKARNIVSRASGMISSGKVRKNKQAVEKTTTSSTSAAKKKITDCEPLDIAAHMRLLGESLTIIGCRLQEHEGQIAVQGSLSLLLDSLLCAMAPLSCLTTQVPELQLPSNDLHCQTLDNISYFMPGIS